MLTDQTSWLSSLWNLERCHYSFELFRSRFGLFLDPLSHPLQSICLQTSLFSHILILLHLNPERVAQTINWRPKYETLKHLNTLSNYMCALMYHFQFHIWFPRITCTENTTITHDLCVKLPCSHPAKQIRGPLLYFGLHSLFATRVPSLYVVHHYWTGLLWSNLTGSDKMNSGITSNSAYMV